MIHILIIILVIVALIITFYPVACRTILNRDREMEEVELEQSEGFIGSVGSLSVLIPPHFPAFTGSMITEGFSAFGGIPVPPGWREGNRAWPGWNTSSPFGPRSSTPSVWY